MAVDKFITVIIRDDDDNIVRDNTFEEEEVESIGGIGSVVDSVEPLLKEGEYIEVAPEYYA